MKEPSIKNSGFIMWPRFTFLAVSVALMGQLYGCGGGGETSENSSSSEIQTNEIQGGGDGKNHMPSNDLGEVKKLQDLDISYIEKNCPFSNEIDKEIPNWCVSGIYKGYSRKTRNPDSSSDIVSCGLEISNDGHASMWFGESKTPRFMASEGMMYYRKMLKYDNNWDMMVSAASPEYHFARFYKVPLFSFVFQFRKSSGFIDMTLISHGKDGFHRNCHVPILVG